MISNEDIITSICDSLFGGTNKKKVTSKLNNSSKQTQDHHDELTTKIVFLRIIKKWKMK